MSAHDDLFTLEPAANGLASASCSAVLSSCGQYRYELWRRWADGPHVLFIMLKPAKHWLADAVLNFKTLLAENDDPSFTLEIGGCVIEIRLNEAPGVFSRRTISLSSDNNQAQ